MTAVTQIRRGKVLKKFLQSFLILTIAAFATVALSAGSFAAPSAANPEDILAFKAGAWSVKSGGKEIKFDGASGSGKQYGHTIEWCVVDPSQLEGAEGLKPGILLYSKSLEGSPYQYLVLGEEALNVLGVSFRPEGWDITVISGLSRFTQLLALYSIEYDENPYEARKSFQLRTDSVFWIEDKDGNLGMAFTMADETVTRPEEAGLFASTAVVYYQPPGDALPNDGLVIVKQATKTESYEVTGVSGGGSELTLAAISVKNENDWTDADKWQESEIKAKLPPMPAPVMPPPSLD